MDIPGLIRHAARCPDCVPVKQESLRHPRQKSQATETLDVECLQREWDAVDRLAALFDMKPDVMARQLIVLGLDAIAREAQADSKDAR
jgi:hypothetical protein